MKNKILLLAMLLALVMGLVVPAARTAEASSITVYVVPTMTDEKILPYTSISPDYISSHISIMASPGEYEPASFVVRANEDIASLTVAPTDLTGANGSIPSTSIDIRVVKCWYQAGKESIVRQASDPKALTPELLLKDDSLVKVQGGENYLKLTSGSYVWISQEGSSTTFEYTPIANLPVADSSTLQPVSIPSGTNKQFWITVKVPDGALSGIYNGSIQLTTSAGLVGELQLRLEVLPIDLSQPYLSYGLTYFGILGDVGSISQGYKNEEQYRAEMEDLVAHGTIDSPCMQPFDATLGQVLTIRNDAGMNNQTLYYRGLYGFLWGSGIPTDLAAVKQKVSEVAAFTAPYGTQEVYHYAIDEGETAVLVAQVPVWEAIHTAGGKVNAGGGDDYTQAFDLVGDALDLYNWPGEPSAAEAAKWHSVDHKIWSYGNPQAGVEKPETYRRNYGLLLWQRVYDGASDFAYQWGRGSLWNDFDGATYRDHVMAYPTMNGVVDTIQWEGWREGVDDARYLTTLLNTIEEAKAAGKDTSAAQNWLAGLRSSDLDLQDLDDMRSTIVGYILSFEAELPSSSAPSPISPTEQSKVIGKSVTFKWSPVAGAVDYKLVVSTSADVLKTSEYKLNVNVGSGDITTYTDSGYLANGTKYYWWVWAYAADGIPSIWAQVSANRRDFTNIGSYVGAPALVSPKDSSEVTGTSVAFEWSPVAGAVDYKLVVSTSADVLKTSEYKLNVNVGSGDITTYVDTGCPAGYKYYWWVWAYNSDGSYSLWSEISANSHWFIYSHEYLT